MPKPKPFTMMIAGKRYRMRYVHRLGKGGKGIDGDAVGPHYKGKEIRCRLGQTPQDELETWIHEVIHVSNWTHNEPHVRRTARNISNELWRIGYRKFENPKAGTRGLSQLQAAIRDAFRDANGTLDKDHVSQTAEDIAKVLWRVGYRKVAPEDAA